MNYRKYLLRFGEVGLKGKNRAFFIRALAANIRRALAVLGEEYRVETPYGRIFVNTPAEYSTGDVARALARVFGLVSFSPVATAELNMEAISNAALVELLAGGQPPTFRVSARRSYKGFALNSMEINKELGALLLKRCPGLKVDLHNPHRVVNVELRREGAYIFSQVYPGPGGLPVGVTGKGVLLLSGGIDSPVAGWMAMKRGVSLEALYFDTPPFTSPRARLKVEKLAGILSRWAPLNLHVANFSQVQRNLMEQVPPDLTITIMRRFMLRVAAALAEQQGALALITGESVGQVASQTLESMATIGAVTTLPLLRPVVALDKVEIMDIAKRIETYATSIEPYPDCCTLFVSPHPKTRPSLAQAVAAEKGMAVSELVADAVASIETIRFQQR